MFRALQVRYDTLHDRRRELYYRDESSDQEEIAAINSRMDELQAQMNALQNANPGNVPIAPFVQKTEAWVTLALKAVIRYAVDAGMQQVAWTTGAQQVQRYNSALQKSVDTIGWKKTEQGIHITGFKDGRVVVDTTEKETLLSDSIGKTMADQIINDPDPQGTISGSNIKISDTGMAAFYDEMLPNIVNKYLKKFGAKVEDIALTKDDNRFTYHFYMGEWRIFEDGLGGLPYGPALKDGEHARLKAKELNVLHGAKAKIQQGFKITDEMRNSIEKNSQPLFSPRMRPDITAPGETTAQALQRQWQDKFNRFKVIQDWARSNGIPLTDAADVYRAEALFYGRTATRTEDFRERVLAPIIKRLQKAGFTLSDAEVFLHAQHAQERNRQIAKINPKMPDGGSGMSNATAKSILARTPPELKLIANEFQKITDYSRNILLAAGIIDSDMVNAWSAAYQRYVPLKGADEAVQGGTGKGYDVNRKMKRAMGHDVRDEHIIENIVRDHERAIMLAEKNRVGLHLLALAIELDDPDLITVDKPVRRAIIKPGTPVY